MSFAHPCCADERPNVVIVFVDDLDFDEVPIYDLSRFPSHTGMKLQGYYDDDRPPHADVPQGDYFDPPRMLMPNLEAMAADGLVLNRFYITSPICTPSRYSILTGRYASRSQAFRQRYPDGSPASVDWSTSLLPSESNLPKALRANGYTTGIVGKWHLGGGIDGYTKDLKQLDPSIPEHNQRIVAAQRATCEAFDQHGFDFAESIFTGNVPEMKIPRELMRENLDWITQGALNFLDAQGDGTPFYLYMSIPIPHAQYYDRMVRGGTHFWWDDDPRVTPGGILDVAPTAQPSRAGVLRRVEDAGLPRIHSMGTWIDDSLGAVLAKLEEKGLAENTLVIFTSDHQSRGKNTITESARVPFVAQWPAKIEPGRRSDALCSNVDLVTTLLDLTDTQVPASDVGRDGVSVAGVFLGQSDTGRGSLLLECMYTRGVVTPRWKYIASRATPEIEAAMAEDAVLAAEENRRRRVGWDGRNNANKIGLGVGMDSDRDFPGYFDPDQLYDLEADPFEQFNLAADPAHRQTLVELQNELRGYLEDMPHPFGEFSEPN
ncbi:MAG: sulfatase-like hydrolase/transferase [Planctomycetota bacterium]